ncbi:ABC transporter ATP-binding protein [Pseudofrankia asymbiotica]|uniref:ABC transporter permease n=1 Tax=Pseudofrankia asymbiotica TaxID=1834516 RepID=A0A1V2I255_9ACTN|nr:ABC transporter ATP-binding protein [Pseudofrankia asymbiotica]ONH23990.1 ABC transporter permease [Pseudofrankia asymbiotica]
MPAPGDVPDEPPNPGGHVVDHLNPPGFARSALAIDGTRSVIQRGLRILLLAVREERRLFALSVFGSALFGLATVASSYVLGEVTQRVIVPYLRDGHAAWGSVVTAASLVFAVGATRAVGMFFRRFAAGVLQYRMQAHYRRRVTRQYLRLPLAWHQRHSTGALLSNANADVEALWAPIAPFPFAVGVVVMLAAAIALLVATDPLLAAVGFVVFPLVGVLNLTYSRLVSPLFARVQELRAEVSAVAHESFDGALVIKTLGREADETVRFRRSAEQLRDAMIRAGRVRGVFDPLMEALPNFGVLAVLVVGAHRIGSGDLSVGDLVRVAYLFTLLAFPIRAIGWVISEMPRSVVGWGRVSAVLTAEGEQEFGTERLAGTGPATLRLEGVGYRYPTPAPAPAPVGAAGGTERPGGDEETEAAAALAEVTFEARPGKVLAVTGRTGAGKSTLVSLLARLVDPDTGTVRLDGADLRDLAADEVTSAVALVAQQAFLFDDTVRANITLGLDLSDDAVWEALRLAQADRFVEALPSGLDTEVGERGTTLSGGQRQRISLARALVRRPRLLVLDDATSSVDPRVEASILAGLRALGSAGSSTVVVVAHRRATIALADEVVYLESGRVAAHGRHDELLVGSPGYAELLTAYERAAADLEAPTGSDAPADLGLDTDDPRHGDAFDEEVLS